MKRIFPIFTLMIFLIITLGCGNKEPKIVELSPIDSLGWNEDECTFKHVSDLVIINNEMFVSDMMTSEINVFSASDYSFKRCISTKGAGPKETFFPIALAANDGNLLVSDMLNARIKEIDTDGNLISNITGIQAYDLFQLNKETIVRTYHNSMDLSLLHKLMGDSLKSYLKPEIFFNEFVKPDNDVIPQYQMNMNSEKIIYAFHNAEKTTLCLDIKSGKITVFPNLTKSKFENIHSILLDEDYIYFLFISSKDHVSGVEPSRLVKTDLSGNVISSATLTDVLPSNLMYKDGSLLYLYDFNTATIKVYELKVF